MEQLPLVLEHNRITFLLGHLVLQLAERGGRERICDLHGHRRANLAARLGPSVLKPHLKFKRREFGACLEKNATVLNHAFNIDSTWILDSGSPVRASSLSRR